MSKLFTLQPTGYLILARSNRLSSVYNSILSKPIPFLPCDSVRTHIEVLLLFYLKPSIVNCFPLLGDVLVNTVILFPTSNIAPSEDFTVKIS